MKTSPKRSSSVIENERFGLVFAKTGSIISGTGFLLFYNELKKFSGCINQRKKVLKSNKEIFIVPNKTICDKKIQRPQNSLCRSWSRSRSSDLWLRGAERITMLTAPHSATLLILNKNFPTLFHPSGSIVVPDFHSYKNVKKHPDTGTMFTNTSVSSRQHKLVNKVEVNKKTCGIQSVYKYIFN